MEADKIAKSFGCKREEVRFKIAWTLISLVDLLSCCSALLSEL
jgi:hypothetical protein